MKNYNFTQEKTSFTKKSGSEISGVQIFRKPDRLTIVINTSRPGVIIGADGKNIQSLTKDIAKITSSKIDIKIKEIKFPIQDLF